ncbi:MAG TPA: helix-turn-helix transcriptional regulator [Armatimonadota bacterium]|nr:helix-turn-helix transcriptional regulator [Armatimonadota bacterium]
MPVQTRVDPEFGRVVREAIGSLSQSEVGLRARISVGYLNRMARGSVPSREIILRLAEGLEIDPAPLLGAAGYDSEPVAAGDDGPEKNAPESDELGPVAAAQEYRALWDRYVAPLFPDAEIPSGAGLPLSRAAILSRVLRILQELIEEQEAARG